MSSAREILDHFAKFGPILGLYAATFDKSSCDILMLITDCEVMGHLFKFILESANSVKYSTLNERSV